MLPLLLVALAPAAEPAVPPEPLDRLVLTDGQTLVGNVKAEEGHWALTLTDGTVLAFPDEAVLRVEWDDANAPGEVRRKGWNALPESWAEGPTAWPDDPDGDRYLLWSSGRSLGKGKGSLSQREVAATIVSYNLSDNVELSAGAVVPLLFSEYSRAATGGVRLSAPIGDGGFGALGVQGLVLGESAFVAPHASIGWEFGRLMVTVGGGAAVGTDPDVISLGMLGASWHLSPRVWLLTETWFAAGGFLGEAPRAFPSFATRMITRRVSFDAGLAVLDLYGDGTTFIPMPVFSVAWHFPQAAF